jgi:hypothetical protein
MTHCYYLLRSMKPPGEIVLGDRHYLLQAVLPEDVRTYVDQMP